MEFWGLFFSTPIECNIFRRSLVVVSKNKLFVLGGTLFFSNTIKIFKTKRKCHLLSLIVFLAFCFKVSQCNLCQAQASANKDRKVSSTKIFCTVTKKFSTKNLDTSLFHEVFLLPETFRDPEEFPYETFRFCQTKNLLTKIRIPHFA